MFKNTIFFTIATNKNLWRSFEQKTIKIFLLFGNNVISSVKLIYDKLKRLSNKVLAAFSVSYYLCKIFSYEGSLKIQQISLFSNASKINFLEVSVDEAAFSYKFDLRKLYYLK